MGNIDFNEYLIKLDVNETVESLVRDVINGESEIKTLTHSYKLTVLAHSKQLDKLSQLDEYGDYHELIKTKLNEIKSIKNEIDNSIDVIHVHQLYEQFKELFSELKSDDLQEQFLINQLGLIKKKNEQFLRLTQTRLDEYCQRIMVMAEVQRNRKRNFDDNLEKEKHKLKDKMASNIVEDFQKLRISTLKKRIQKTEKDHLKYYNSCLDTYKTVVEQNKVLSAHVFQLENQLRSAKFEKRKLPYEHEREVNELAKTVHEYNIKISQLKDKLRSAQVIRVNSVAMARKEKKKLDFILAKLLSNTSRLQATLCTLSHQAIRRKVRLPASILDIICTNESGECFCASKTIK